ncbi:hypothetical protein FACS189428_2160 [Clostridia bacterium]|nr:hypothetical protein FACS189428_2160 [Clostridia bacterium]
MLTIIITISAVILVVIYLCAFTPNQLERRKQKKAEQFAREQEHERLTGKYRGKKAIYSREKDALIDKEGCIFEELQFKNISTGLEFTDYCPKNIPVIIVQAGWKTVYCTLDEESDFFSYYQRYIW